MGAEPIHAFVAADAEVDRLEALLKDAKERRGLAEQRALDWVERTGFPSVDLGDERQVYLKRSLHASIPASVPRDKLRRVLAQCGMSDLLKDAVNAQQLSAVIRGLENDGQEIPPALRSILTVYEKFSLVICRS